MKTKHQVQKYNGEGEKQKSTILKGPLKVFKRKGGSHGVEADCWEFNASVGCIMSSRLA